jgi:type II secretory pathway pseudopilin PulG
LVELLVVIAILAVLASLLLTAVGRSRQSAQASQCRGNLKQWGAAYRMYADDNDDYLPRRGQGVQALTVIGRPEDWFNALPPYFGLPTFSEMVANNSKPAAHDKSVFICPPAKDTGGTYFLPYGMNMNLSPWNLPLATKFGEVAQPACVVAMADAPGAYASTYPSPRPYGIVARHCRQVNLLFLTGQAQSFAGDFVGCGVGDPGRQDVRWLTGTASDAQAGSY